MALEYEIYEELGRGEEDVEEQGGAGDGVSIEQPSSTPLLGLGWSREVRVTVCR